jgi:hypothetical protein
MNAEYGFSRRYTLFLAASDLNRRTNAVLRYAPETPEFARSTRYARLGAYITIGVKGRF